MTDDPNVVIRLRVDGDAAASEALRRTAAAGRAGFAEFSRETARASQSYERFTGAAARAERSLRTETIRQVGFQVGDFAVQVASGTNALVAFTQQGAQLAGFFGPAGAMVGAVGAVAGALATTFLPSIFEGRDAADALRERSEAAGAAIANLRSAAVTGAEGLRALVETYGTLDGQLIGLIQRQTQLNVLLARTELREAITGLPGSAEALSDTLTGMPRGIGQATEFSGFVARSGLSREPVERLRAGLIDLRSAGDFDAQQAALGRIGAAFDGADLSRASEDVLRFAAEVNRLELRLREFAEAEREAGEAATLAARPIAELMRLAAEPRRGGGRRERADPFERALDAADGRIAQLAARRESVGATPLRRDLAAAEAEALRLERELADAAREAGVSQTDAADRITRRADAYQRLATEAALAAETERLVAQTLREAGEAAARQRQDVEGLTRDMFRLVGQADDVGDAFLRLGLRLAEEAALGALLGRGALGGLGEFLTGREGGLLGGLIPAGANVVGVPGGAFGGVFAVPGAGAADSVTAVMRVSPGERIAVGGRQPRRAGRDGQRLRGRAVSRTRPGAGARPGRRADGGRRGAGDGAGGEERMRPRHAAAMRRRRIRWEARP